ncbi:aldo/keto reductase [Oceanicella sp. SM1341]|uniref:aldo/keto reductase n=1 Tax=Oceanicella sp. SM1341 TaxID=1548889 RepID=UPI000E54A07B|nr:aldo/keto reductase [Oceanicella sp. SM1341]
MHRRALGNTGFDIAPLVFGGNVLGWTADEARSFAVLDAFIDHGFNAIDTADVYSAWVPGNAGGESESIIGRWLKARPGMRERIVLFTKVGSQMGAPERKGLSRRWILQAVEESLARLGVEAIDLYFSHWPDDTPPEETLGAYDALLKAGKIRAIGASNFSADQLAASLAAAESGLPAYQVLQPELNLCKRDGFDGPLQELCRARGLGVVTYFSLASGFLTGKYRSKADLAGSARGAAVEKYLDDKGMRLLSALDTVSARHGATPAEVSLAWLMAHPGVTAPIASATSPGQVGHFARAAELALTPGDMALLDGAGG